MPAPLPPANCRANSRTCSRATGSYPIWLPHSPPPPSATRLRPITARRHAKLLHHLVRKLVRRAIPPRRLRKEPVIVVPAIHQETRVVSSNPAIRKIPVRSRRQPPRILRHPRHQQQQIREPPPVQRQVLNRPLIHQRRHQTRIHLQHPGSLRHGDRFLRPRHHQLEGQQRRRSYLHPNRWRNLQTHACRLRSRQILPRRKQVHRKSSRKIRARVVPNPRLPPDG